MEKRRTPTGERETAGQPQRSTTAKRLTATRQIVLYRVLLKLVNGEPADPAVFVTERESWQPGDSFAARDGSQWRIVSVDTAPPLLAEEGFDARWIAE
jgi:hypothetical protein